MSEHIIVTEVCYGVPFVPIGGTGELREEIVRCSDCVHYAQKTKPSITTTAAHGVSRSSLTASAHGGEEMSDIATVKVELSDEQTDVLLRDIGDLIGRVGALEQRISDVNDAAFYDFAQLERRIESMYGRLDGIEKGVEVRLREIESRIERMERKL